MNVEALFDEALTLFSEILQLCKPSDPERKLAQDREEIRELADENAYNPLDVQDGRKKILQNIAVRQGQRKFRNQLIEAYEGKCAVTGYAVLDVLQAAHIVPYNGKITNEPANGLLLRSDIHDLFDWFLHAINPFDWSIKISKLLSESDYADLDGKKIELPESSKYYPSKIALEWHFEQLKD